MSSNAAPTATENSAAEPVAALTPFWVVVGPAMGPAVALGLARFAYALLLLARNARRSQAEFHDRGVDENRQGSRLSGRRAGGGAPGTAAGRQWVFRSACF
jgi:hypothetical protein